MFILTNYFSSLLSDYCIKKCKNAWKCYGFLKPATKTAERMRSKASNLGLNKNLSPQFGTQFSGLYNKAIKYWVIQLKIMRKGTI